MRARQAGVVLLAVLIARPAVAADESPAVGAAFQDCPTCPVMVMVPRASNLAPFAIGRFEVTFDQWIACVRAGGCPGGQDDHGWGKGTRPVINVSWSDACTYVAWLSKITGNDYALPNEREWEHAARGGGGGSYWWGDDIGTGMANCRDCGSKWGGQSTAPVGSFPPNPYGLYDMNGNVWEWTADCWQPPGGSTGPACRDRVIKGGAWYYFPRMSASATRSHMEAGQGSYTIGFRVLRRYPSGM